jgi:hypothetical protein
VCIYGAAIYAFPRLPSRQPPLPNKTNKKENNMNNYMILESKEVKMLKSDNYNYFFNKKKKRLIVLRKKREISKRATRNLEKN